jgi:hypothetical protein
MHAHALDFVNELGSTLSIRFGFGAHEVSHRTKKLRTSHALFHINAIANIEQLIIFLL